MGCWYSRKTDEEKDEDKQIEKIREDLQKLEYDYDRWYIEREKIYRIWNKKIRLQSTKQRLWLDGNLIYTTCQYHLIRSIWRHRYTDGGISDNEMKYIHGCLDKLVIFEEPYEGYRKDVCGKQWLNIKFPDILLMKKCIKDYCDLDCLFDVRDCKLSPHYYIWNRRKFAVVLWKLCWEYYE